MAYTSSALAPRDFQDAKPVKGPGLFTRMFKRMFDAMNAARMRQAEREIARYLAADGGVKFTDEAEREIERRFLSHRARW